MIALGLHGRVAGEGEAATRRRVLDGLIEQRLRLHEIDRFGFEQVPVDQIDRQLAQLRARFGDEAAFHAELARLGLDRSRGCGSSSPASSSILTYVEERLGPRVFVGLEDIRRYFDEELVPELTRRGEPVPEIENVREQIRAILRERALDQEIARWTEDLRKNADVVDLLDAEPRALPPVQFEIPSGAEPGRSHRGSLAYSESLRSSSSVSSRSSTARLLRERRLGRRRSDPGGRREDALRR